MPKVTLTDIQSGSGVKDTYNANNDTIEAAFDNTLSRDGSTPNGMGADLDMNSNKVINVADGVNNQDGVNVKQLNSAIAAAGSGLIVQQIETKLGSNATANKFTLTGISYNPGANTLAVYRNGQRLRRTIDYTETSETEVTLMFTPNDDDGFDFITNESTTSSVSDAASVTYTPSGTGAVATNVQAKLREFVSVKDFGVVGSGDETSKLVSALNALSDGDTLDLNGLTITVFNGVSGVTSGDAIALASVPRLYQKNRVTIQNGKIVCDSPSVSGTKYRFPSTFTVDECTDITFRDVTFHAKGENWGDTDASVGLTDDQQREFAAQNGGHAMVVIRSERVNALNCNFRLCGSVAAFYSMSSHDVKLVNCFANAASLGYACYAFDSWAGDTGVSGFPKHAATMINCSADKEGYTYGSKGCVVTEDDDVHLTVIGGYYADAYPNGSSRDIGYAFGGSSSTTVVSGVIVDNCACVGYTGTTNNTDYTYMQIDNVRARNLRKTVHQTEDTSVGRMYWKYANGEFDVAGGGEWAGDGDLSREQTSYVALPNDALRLHGSFVQCSFTGATYGFISTTSCFGYLKFVLCDIETNGFLWNSKNIGSGAAGDKTTRGILFDRCAIEDVSAESGAYTTTVSSTIYTYIDLSTSTITLNSARAIEASTITTPSTFVERYMFPRDDANIESISAETALLADSAKTQVIDPTGSSRNLLLPRSDKYKFMDFKIVNASGSQNLVVKDYTSSTTYVTLTPGQAALAWNDGATDYVRTL